MRKVFIGTPSYDGDVTVWYADSLWASMALITPELMFYPRWQLGGPLEHVRNLMCKSALDSGMDDLVFIDSDMAWAPDQLGRLLSHDVPIVSGIYLKTDGTNQLVMRQAKGAKLRADGLIEVEAIGAGFLRLRRDALEKMAKSSERYHSSDQGDIPRIFEVTYPEGGMVSEDVSMAQKFRAAGGQVWADTRIIARHFGKQAFIPPQNATIPIATAEKLSRKGKLKIVKQGNRQRVAPK